MQSSVSLQRALLILLILVYFVLGTLFALRTPDWQAPDEPAHYNYVAQVAANGCCPLLETGDWDSPYLESLKAARFAPDTLGELSAVQYEDHQPPLYYLLASLVYKLSPSLIALRLLSVGLGVGVVLGAYAVGRALLPAHPQIALGTAALVAFVPQHLAVLSSANNDSLAELIVAWTLWGIVVYLKTERVKAWQLGVLVGIGLLTKISTIFLVGLVPLAILIKWWIGRRERETSFGRVIREGVLFALPALVLTSIWVVRNLSTYGFPDMFGLGRHNVVVADQLRTADLMAQVGTSEYFRRALGTTFNSFWGQFGWMAAPLPDVVYTLIALGLVVAGVGFVISMVRRLAPEPDQAAQRAAWGILALTAALAVAQYIYYNLEFVQFQGRYMYPGLIPLGLGIALGLDGWRRLVFGANERSIRRYAGVALILLLVPLDLYIVWRVLPGLAP